MQGYGKPGYERAAQILKEIAAETKPGREIPLSEAGRKAVTAITAEHSVSAHRLHERTADHDNR
jgi:hypothetical protein